jgi:cytochrome c peroxidase
MPRQIVATLGIAFTLACATGPAFGPVPLGLDLYTPVPETSPITTRKIRLGRQLFHDKRLSADGSLACASCHLPERAFSQPRPIAVGVHGRSGTRNAPALLNRAWGRSFFWDGRTTTLEEQVLRPIEDPNEMGSSVEAAAGRAGVKRGTLADALASYVRSIRTGDSPVDRFEKGEVAALSDEARAGFQVFRGKGNCTLCHIGPNLTDESFHNTGVAWEPSIGGSSTSGRFLDDGRAIVTRRDRDRGAFKTPTLREVSRTAPYMHDGSLATLEDVVNFYDDGGRPNRHLDISIRPLKLTGDEKRGLVGFLASLSGRVTEGPVRR